MWEWQSLLQTSHLCLVSGRMELLPSFLRARLSATAVINLSSPVLRCCFRALLHFVRSTAIPPPPDIVSMSTAYDITRMSYERALITLWSCMPITNGCSLIFYLLKTLCRTKRPVQAIVVVVGPK